MTIPQEVLHFENNLHDMIFDLTQQQINHLYQHQKYQQQAFVVSGGLIRVDEYVGPLGAGYIINLQFGDWRKSSDYGPEGRSRDWHLIT